MFKQQFFVSNVQQKINFVFIFKDVVNFDVLIKYLVIIWLKYIILINL